MPVLSLPERIDVLLEVLSAIDDEIDGFAVRDLAPRQALYVVVRDTFGGGFVRPGNGSAVELLASRPWASARLTVIADAYVHRFDDEFETTSFLVPTGVNDMGLAWDAERDIDRQLALAANGVHAGQRFARAVVSACVDNPQHASLDRWSKQLGPELAASDAWASESIGTCAVLGAHVAALLACRAPLRSPGDDAPSVDSRRLVGGLMHAVDGCSRPQVPSAREAEWMRVLARHMGLPPVADSVPL